MKIGIDAREINVKDGKGRYVSELVQALSKIDKENEYYIFVNENLGQLLPSNFSVISILGNAYWFIYRYLRREKIDLMLSPTSFLMAVVSPVPMILVVHDLAVFLEPRANPSFKTKLLEKLFLPLAVKKARSVITVSKSTAKDLIGLFPKAKSIITTIHLAPFPLDRSRRDLKDIQLKYKLPRRFILYVGTLEPRKNVDGLIKSYCQLSKDIKEVFPLVLVGKRGWNMQEINNALAANNLPASIIEVGFVPDEDLPAFYKLASLFVYPSWYEGFGFPVLEALAAGLPVITSSTSSLPEVAGDAAVLINPNDQVGLTGAMTRILCSSSEADQLKKLGLAQAQKFSWAKTASETLRVLKEGTES